MIARSLRLLCFVVVLAFNVLSATAADGQDMRVVRLAWVQGDVQFYRTSAIGWEPAINNINIGGDVRVRAAEASSAIVELEDGSSIRLEGPAQVALQLSESLDGAPVDRVEINTGVVEISAVLAARADFRVRDRVGSTYVIAQPSTVRFQVDAQAASLNVIEGEVEAWGVAGYSLLRDGESYSYQLPKPKRLAR
jgi:ferric-dicitrate binding protein FerR (iron transport regulator)